jgi:hypothetical protein
MKATCMTRLGNVLLIPALLLSVHSGGALPAAEEAITVNVTSDVYTTTTNPEGRFRGFGINIVSHMANGRDWYASAPQALRDAWVKTYWVDLDMRVMRLWCGNGMDITTMHTADQMYEMYRLYIDDVKKQQKNKLTMIFDPHSGWSYDDEHRSWSKSMTEDKLRAYVVRHADVVKELWTKYQWKMDYVEITNEPEVYGKDGGWKNPELWGKALVMAKMWREELDRRDLTDVKIMGPSRGAVNLADAPQTIAAFKADPAALKAWDAYSFHNYNAGMLKSVRDQLKELDRDMIQNESGGIPYTRGVALAISDINLGTTMWCHFQGYGYDRDSGSNDGAGGENTTFFNGIRFAGVINEGQPDMDVRPFAKFFYLRELAKTVTVGSQVHLCSTDRTQAPSTWMECTYGPMTPITATAALQPDGRWGLIVFNTSSDRKQPEQDYGFVAHPPTTFDVTFDVPKLAGAGTQAFTARKITPQREELDLPGLTMQDGRITVRGLKPEEMVSLRSVGVAALKNR